MQPLQSLDLFLTHNLSFTEAAVYSGLKPGNFRNAVFDDIRLLSRHFNVSFHPLRHLHLRQQATALRELMNLYEHSDLR